MVTANPNVLSERYATPEINALFSEYERTLLEREFWIEVMKAQRELGVNIPAEDIEKFEKAKGDIDLARIREIEEKNRHDIKAKIEAFIEVSGAGQHLHKGMTSRDLSDNVELIQQRRASEIIFGREVSVLRHLMDKAEEYGDLVITARTHHQAAQPTTLGRRFSMWAEELLPNLESFERFIKEYPMRGIKGPVGTMKDMTSLLGSTHKAAALEVRIADHFGFERILESPGQVYPRSLDYALITQLAGMTSAQENFAQTMRLMAGYDLVTEGFKEGQVGSTAMPYKMNTRTSERIVGFGAILKGLAATAAFLTGSQWEEGDVSCSVVRRHTIPNAFYAIDGSCEATLTALNEMGAYPRVIEAEVQRYLPFLAATEILMEATRRGLGREQAHKIIRDCSVAEALRMRIEGTTDNRLAERLANDPTLRSAGITYDGIQRILLDRIKFIGDTRNQIEEVKSGAELMIDKYKEEASYEPRRIL